jgi:TonB family protein
MKTYLRLLVPCCALSLLFPGSMAAEAVAARSEPTSPALTIVKEVKPFFPARLLEDGVARGEVAVAINVDENGRIVDALVIRYTHKEFADAVTPVLKDWVFQPLVIDGQAVRAVAEIQFRFEVNGVLVVNRTLSAGRNSSMWSSDTYAFEPCAPNDLDRSIKPTRVVKPVYPQSLSDQSISGEVYLEFFIDEDGRPRFPVATYARHNALAAIATAALEQWQFEPPRRQGRPVIVRANQRFTFVPAPAETKS